MTQSRIQSLDILKLIAIFLVFIVQSRFLCFINFDTIPPILFNAAIAPLLALLLLVGCQAVTWLLRQNKYTSYWLLGIRSTQPSTQP